jgi:hypothetical protein
MEKAGRRLRTSAGRNLDEACPFLQLKGESSGFTGAYGIFCSSKYINS